jgi:hypothetical protein
MGVLMEKKPMCSQVSLIIMGESHVIMMFYLNAFNLYLIAPGVSRTVRPMMLGYGNAFAIL